MLDKQRKRPNAFLTCQKWMQTVVLASNNPHKFREIKSILKKQVPAVRLLSLKSFPKVKRVREDQPTLEANAAKKARVVALKTGFPALADDSGLFVPSLKGAPGVYSARFAGPRCNYDDNNRKLLSLLAKFPWSRREADFRCVAALATPKGKVLFAKGEIRGKIAFEVRGKNGFGYDPIFWIPKYRRTFAEIPASLKNKISHRAQAFSRAAGLLKKRFL